MWLRPNAAAPSFDQIQLKKRFPPKLRQWHDRLNEGWDTETIDGKATMLASSQGWKEPTGLLDILQHLTTKKQNSRRHVWWNLRYDVTALFKWEPDRLIELELTGETEYEDYKIYYLRNKFMRIRSPAKRTFYHYDIAQFYRQSLANAAKKYLGRESPDIKQDRADLSGHTTQEIGEYCQWDATATKDLADLYTQNLEGIGLAPKHLISAGNIAQQIQVSQADVPCWVHQPRLATRMGWMAQRGAWVDVWQRGEAHVYKYDINSAYPAEMHDMPDVRDGYWTREPNPCDAAYGFVRCTIQYGPDTPPILAHFDGSTNVFPHIDQPTTAVITQDEYNYLKETGAKITGDDIWFSFIPNNDARKPWQDLIDRLMAVKNKEKQLQGTSRFDPGKYLVAKETVNSLYGKSCERIEQEDKTWKAGLLFNPVISSHILARTRIKVAKASQQQPTCIVNVATDSLCSTKPLDLDLGTGLGQWTDETMGEPKPGIFLQPGRYQIEGEDPMTRGFSLKSMRGSGYDSYWGLCQAGGDRAKLVVNRPYTGRQAARWGRIQDANIFTEQEYIVTPYNTRRLWDQEITDFRDLLGTTHRSTPLPISLVERNYRNLK